MTIKPESIDNLISSLGPNDMPIFGLGQVSVIAESTEAAIDNPRPLVDLGDSIVVLGTVASLDILGD